MKSATLVWSWWCTFFKSQELHECMGCFLWPEKERNKCFEGQFAPLPCYHNFPILDICYPQYKRPFISNTSYLPFQPTSEVPHLATGTLVQPQKVLLEIWSHIPSHMSSRAQGFFILASSFEYTSQKKWQYNYYVPHKCLVIVYDLYLLSGDLGS